LLGVAVVVSVSLGSVAVAASTRFSDVPPGHAFEDEIDWMADTGITTGFPDDTFRPGAAVSRGSMSAFMQRLFNLRDQVKVASSASSTTITGTDYANVTGASTTVTVPDGTTATIIAELTGESTCSGAPAPGFCDVRLRLDGVEMTPQHPEGYHFSIDSNDHGTEGPNSTEGHSITRYATAVGPGSHTITVQGRVNTAGVSFVLGDWVLVGRTILDPAP
jgi:hypothetical protein